MSGAVTVLRRLLEHPLGGRCPTRTVLRFLKWQATVRLRRGTRTVRFVDSTRLRIARGMHGATGNHYVGLLEFEPMAFLPHVLRPEDLFLDVGANVGSYTVLASGAVGASTIAFEPVARAADALRANVALNEMTHRVIVQQVAVGDREGSVEVTTASDSTNRVATVAGPDHVTVPLVALDALELPAPHSGSGRVVLKADVEGFEANVLRGARRLLTSGAMLAVIVELNGSGAAYGRSDTDVQEELHAAGLFEVAYDPFARELTVGGVPTAETRVFVRDIEDCRSRVESAPRRQLGTGYVI